MRIFGVRNDEVRLTFIQLYTFANTILFRMRTATHTTSHFEHTNFEFLGNLNAHKVSIHRKDTYVSACKMSYWAMGIVNLVLKVSWMGETCVYIEWHDTFQPAKWTIGQKLLLFLSFNDGWFTACVAVYAFRSLLVFFTIR